MPNVLTSDNVGRVDVRVGEGEVHEAQWLPPASVPGSFVGANDLVTSTNLHQWVSGISGQNGTGATCTVRAGVTLVQTQAAAENETLFRIQPHTAGAAPFESFLSTHVFLGTDDNTWALGYNASNSVPGEPVAFWNIEANFHASAGPDVFQLEHYINCQTPAAGIAVRPLGYVLDRLTGAVTTQVTFAGDGFQINGGAIGVVPSQLVKFVPTGMQIFPDPWTMTALGAFSLSAVKTLTFIASQAGVASEFSADVIVLGNHLRTSTAFFDNLNDPNHCSFNPQTTNTGAIGKSTNRWGQVWTGSLNVLQTAKTANYTIDSGTAHDFEIDVNTATVGAFAVTLPDPAVNAGRRLSIIDFGNNLTVANVTLTRHGAEKINGVAGNLALILSGARYEIACNGVDWWVTKSVLA